LSPWIFVGYNSIRFDEEMLRHALFRTLHPAYLTRSHGNCRADAWDWRGLPRAHRRPALPFLSIPKAGRSFVWRNWRAPTVSLMAKLTTRCPMLALCWHFAD